MAKHIPTLKYSLPESQPVRQIMPTIGRDSYRRYNSTQSASGVVDSAVNNAMGALYVPQAINHINAGANKFNTILGGVNNCISDVQNFAGNVTNTLGAATNAITTTSSTLTGLQNDLNNAVNSATSLATSITGMASGALGAALGVAVALPVAVVATALGAVAAVPAALGNIAGKALGVVGMAAGAIGNAALGAIGSVLGMAGAMLGFVKDQVSNMMGMAMQMQRSVMAKIDAAIKTVIDIANMGVAGLLSLLPNLNMEWPLLKKISSGLQSAIAEISKIAPVVNSIQRTIADTAQLIDSAMNVVNTVVGSINSVIGSINNTIDSYDRMMYSLTHIGDIFRFDGCGNVSSVDRYVGKHWPRASAMIGNADGARVSHTTKQQVQQNRKASSLENEMMKNLMEKAANNAKNEATNAALEETLNPEISDNVNDLKKYTDESYLPLVENVEKAKDLIEQIYNKLKQDVENSDPEKLWKSCDDLMTAFGVLNHVVYNNKDAFDAYQRNGYILDIMQSVIAIIELVPELTDNVDNKYEILEHVLNVEVRAAELGISIPDPYNKPLTVVNPFGPPSVVLLASEEQQSDVPDIFLNPLMPVLEKVEELRYRVERYGETIDPPLNVVKDLLNRFEELLKKLEEIRDIIYEIIDKTEDEINNIISNNLKIITDGIDEAKKMSDEVFDKQAKDFDTIFDGLEREAEFIDQQSPEVLEEKDDSCQTT